MQRQIEPLADGPIGVDDHAGVDALGAEHHVVEVVLVEHAHVLFEHFDHQPDHLRAIVGGQAPLLRSAHALVLSLDDAALVHAETNGKASLSASPDDSIDLFAVLDVARVEANLVNAGFDRLHRPLVVEVDIGHDWDGRLFEDGRQGGCVGFVGHGHADDVAAGLGQPADLLDRGIHVMGVGAGHGLDDHRGIATNGHAADENLMGFSAWVHGIPGSLPVQPPGIVGNPA